MDLSRGQGSSPILRISRLTLFSYRKLTCVSQTITDLTDPGSIKRSIPHSTLFLVKKNVAFSTTKAIYDTNGRYVIVTGTLYQFPVVLVNAYAPNFDDENVFTKQNKKDKKLFYHQISILYFENYGFVSSSFFFHSCVSAVAQLAAQKSLTM